MLTKKAIINASWIPTEYDIDSPESEMCSKLLPCHGPKRVPTWEEEPNLHSPQLYLDTSPKSEHTLELQSRALPSVEAHHHVNRPNTVKNSSGRQIIKNPWMQIQIQGRWKKICGISEYWLCHLVHTKSLDRISTFQIRVFKHIIDCRMLWKIILLLESINN